MNGKLTGKPVLRKRVLAGLCASLFVGAVPLAAAAGPVQVAAAPCACGAGVYSVINLDPEGGAAAFLNERGQAAVGSFVFGTSAFFDGQRVLPLGDLGGGSTVVKGLNNRGVVLAESVDATPPFGNTVPVTWTPAGGLRTIPGAAGGQVWDINERNQIVGQLPAPGITGRAARFNPDASVLPLGSLPFSLSVASAINDAALAGGYTDAADGTIHATLWNAAGAATDLGSLGGSSAFTVFVNARGEAAGFGNDAADDHQVAFFWNRAGGMTPIGAQDGGARLVAGLNDIGQLVGLTVTPAGLAAYQWSRARGLVELPRAGAPESDVFDINNRSDMVGSLLRPTGRRAVLWRGLTTPIDLNSRLHRMPAGLVLQSGAAINEAGVILAYSNAGLVMLRPGKVGTDAPVLGPVVGLPDSVSVGAEVRARLGFIDNAPSETHTAVADWSDGCTSPSPLVREAWGRGEVALQHSFCAPGFQTLVLRVTDSSGRSTETRRQVLVNEPGLAALSGRGTLAGAAVPAGAAPGHASALPLQFTLWAPLGARPGGASAKAVQAVVALQGPFGFRSDSVGAVTRDGAWVRLAGSGRYNGRAGYGFVVDAEPGGGRGRPHARAHQPPRRGRRRGRRLRQRWASDEQGRHRRGIVSCASRRLGAGRRVARADRLTGGYYIGADALFQCVRFAPTVQKQRSVNRAACLRKCLYHKATFHGCAMSACLDTTLAGFDQPVC